MVRRLLVYAGLGVAALAVLGVLAAGVYIYNVTRDLPSVEALKNYSPPVTTRVYAGNGTVLGEYARESRIFVPAAFIPKLVAEAFTSAEDRNFYSHPGIDPSGILRAALKDVGLVLEGRRPQGASTITQQVARNFLLNSDVKFSRKIREAILAIRIDATYPKSKVLELYLNEIYLGEHSYGVGAAALNYFGKSLDDLDIAEVAFLAALPKGPANYDPRFNHAAAVDRRNWVIGQMAENNYITKEQAAAAKAEPLVAQMRALGSQAADVDYYVEEVRRQLYAKYGEKALYDGGLQVRASLDTRLQNYAVGALRSGLVRYDRRHGWRGAKTHIDINGDWRAQLKKLPNQSGVETWKLSIALGFDQKAIRIGFADGTTGTIPYENYKWARRELKNANVGAAPQKPQDVAKPGDALYVEPEGKTGEFGLRQIPEINGAIVAMDPHTGRVLALSGGFSYASSQFDRAMQAMRQPGSSFKPFVYAAALDSGYTPATIVADEPITVNTPQGLWTPKNAGGGYYGPTPLRTGIEQSRNLMTIRIADDIGMETVARYAEKFGVYDKLSPYLANSLGAQETTLFKMVAAYAMFANGGERVEPTLVDRVQDRRGRTIYRHDRRVCETCDQPALPAGAAPRILTDRERVMDAVTAYQLTSMLEGAVQRGSGRGVSLPVPVAGKTGTTNDAKDVWFIGYTSNMVAGCYLGYDQPRSLGENAYGGTLCVPVFNAFMQKAVQKFGGTSFKVPPGGYFADVSYGKVTIAEYFRDGTRPGDGVVTGTFEREPQSDLLGMLPERASSGGQATQVTTSTGKTKVIPKKADFGTISSGGLY